MRYNFDIVNDLNEIIDVNKSIAVRDTGRNVDQNENNMDKTQDYSIDLSS
ncbi:MAG: hypothetical protein R2774_01055 [Saprospiraceae bacterium]